MSSDGKCVNLMKYTGSVCVFLVKMGRAFRTRKNDMEIFPYAAEESTSRKNGVPVAVKSVSFTMFFFLSEFIAAIGIRK